MKRKLLSILVLLCLTVCGAWADGSWTSGDCTVTLSDAGVLTVSGPGAMAANYQSSGDIPWRNSRTSITSIVINDGVTSIGKYAFYGCSNLTSVSISNTVTNIGTAAFYGCSSLAEITIPNSVTSIGSNAFTNTTWDKDAGKVGLVYAGKVAYKYYGTMPADTHIAIADGTLGIAGNAFSGFTNLKSISIPNTVSDIGENAFYGCSNLETVTIEGNSLKTIGGYAFYNCKKLPEISLPNSVTSIGSYAFQNCTNLGTFTIPNNVETINQNVFYFCSSLTSVTIPNSVKSIGQNAFASCSKLGTVTIPNSVTSIGQGAFQNCTGLGTVTISNSVTTIAPTTFSNCTSLKAVTIPASVTSIGNQAFYRCSSLETVTIYAQSCSLANANAFNNTTNLTNIYVFSNVVDDYQAASNWSTYASKIQAIPALSANEGASNTEYWTTYYNDLTCATAPEGTQVFKVALSGSTLTLTEISDRVINMGEGVVLKSNSPSITLASAASTGTTADGGYEGNVLTGTMSSITNPGNAYVLNKTDENGVGFYKLSSGGTIGANKAYLTYDGTLARGFFGFDDATGIAPIDNGQWIMDNEADAVVYDMQGRRVSQPAKGLYIVRSAEGRLQGKNGKKYIKK